MGGVVGGGEAQAAAVRLFVAGLGGVVRGGAEQVGQFARLRGGEACLNGDSRAVGREFDKEAFVEVAGRTDADSRSGEVGNEVLLHGWGGGPGAGVCQPWQTSPPPPVDSRPSIDFLRFKLFVLPVDSPPV